MRPCSDAIFAQSCRLIPGGVNSPARSFQGLGMTPLIARSGKGAILQDVDGREYIDYCGSWGALILGHAHSAVTRAATHQIELGSSFGIATEAEALLAASIQEAMPSLEKLRCVSSGTEAVMTALRIARGSTGRSKIVKFVGHYHGHSDALLVQAGSGVAHLPLSSSLGIPRGAIEDTLCLPFNDAAAVTALFQKHPHEIAAVIVEPVAGNMGVVPAERSFLEHLRSETARHGALLILDEVITGFRVGLHGAQALYGIEPDLTCLGKIIGGGFPAAAVGGKALWMDQLAPLGGIYQAGTLSGNPVAMRAGAAALAELRAPSFYEDLDAKTARLTDPLAAFFKRRGLPHCVQRVGSMFTVFLGVKQVSRRVPLDQELFAPFFRHLFERGIYIPPSPYEAWFISSAHTEQHLETTLATLLEFFS